MELIGELLLPALSLARDLSPLAYELWELLKLLPYDNRFSLYGVWRKQYSKVVAHSPA